MHDFLARTENQKKRSEQLSNNRGKVARKIGGKLLFAISKAIIT